MHPLLATVAGFALLALGAPLVLLLPEVGVPLVLVALRLLGRRYAWARRANARIDAGWRRLKAWFHRRHAAVRWGIVLAALALLVWLGWLTYTHL